MPKETPCRPDVAVGWVALNVFGAALIFMFAYPPQDDRRQFSHPTVEARVLLVFPIFCFIRGALYEGR
jgi:hypothetical protein